MMTIFMVYLLFNAGQPPQQPNVDLDKLLIPPQPVQAEPAEQPTDSGEATPTIAATEAEPAWVTLGSLNPDSPYRMLITFTNQGAAPSRIELNTPQYRDVQELSGYLGQIVADQRFADTAGDGVTIQVVGHGTPAHKFGLEKDDKIVQVDLLNRNTRNQESTEVKTFADLRDALLNTRPGDFVDLIVVRNGNRIEQQIQLGQYPMDLIRPETVPTTYEEYRSMGGLRGVDEKSDQLSFLMTLQQINEQQLDLPASQSVSNAGQRGMIKPDETLGIELPNVGLRKEYWEIVSATEDNVVFRRTVPQWNLEVSKTYQLQKREPHSTRKGDGYELTLTVAVKNLDEKAVQKIAYQLDGPTCLPLEGGWYAWKAGPGWGQYGIRDLVIRGDKDKSHVISNNEIHIDKVDVRSDFTPAYIGVDSLFFQCTLKPDKSPTDEAWHNKVFPIRVGIKNTEWIKLTNVSFRMWSKAKELQPNEQIEHVYTVFAGPKDTAVLKEHGLSDTLSYGWFWFAAIPLVSVLHFFHSLGMTHAMAIIALTICVRLLLFPLSIKQAIGAIKMQQIQPEMKALAEKYKDDLQARSKAQSALFKKHNYHPLSGCLPIFIQLPIFIGLYKALCIDAGLYGSPLISSSVRWCRDLSAPDMLYDWSAFWNWLGWTSFNTGQGALALGPYFSLLPVLTVVLFLTQMMITMPPPTDDQSRLQRKMFQFMMIFMGFLFFRMPSGLCLYFIVSTTWGLLERRFIPKASAQPVADQTIDIEPLEVKKPSAKTSTNKRGSKNRGEVVPQKPEGKFAKWWRELLEKAAEQQKLGQQSKEKDKKKKKR